MAGHWGGRHSETCLLVVFWPLRHMVSAEAKPECRVTSQVPLQLDRGPSGTGGTPLKGALWGWGIRALEGLEPLWSTPQRCPFGSCVHPQVGPLEDESPSGDTHLGTHSWSRYGPRCCGARQRDAQKPR